LYAGAAWWLAAHAHAVAAFLADHERVLTPLGVIIAAAAFALSAVTERQRWQSRLSGRLVMFTFHRLPYPDDAWWSGTILLRNASHRPTAIHRASFEWEPTNTGELRLPCLVPEVPVLIDAWQVVEIHVVLRPAEADARALVLHDLDDNALALPIGLSATKERLTWRRASRFSAWLVSRRDGARRARRRD
jgi:hypothetical protein